MGATRECSRFASRVDIQELPPAIIERARLLLLDAIGCGVFGTRLLHCQQMLKVALSLGGNGEAGIIGTGFKSSAYLAALVNGTQIHGYELDDVGVYNHPAASIIPAALAMAERCSGATGADLLAGIVAGYEVATRFAEATGFGTEAEVGWHTPGFHGAVGGVVTAGRVARYSEEQVYSALCIAGDLAGGGLMSARTTAAATKKLHSGRGAATGVLGALLAAEGFTGVQDVLELEPWGLAWALTGYHGTGTIPWNMDEVVSGLGREYTFPEKVTFKYYPAVGQSQSVLDNVRGLVKEHGFSAGDVESVKIRMATFHFRSRVRRRIDDLSGTNFSPPYAAALAIMYDIPPLDQSRTSLELWPEKFRDADVQALIDRIEEVPDPAIDVVNPYSIDTRIEVRLRDGRVVERSSSYEHNVPSLGTKRLRPLTREELEAKFRNMTHDILPRAQADEFIRQCGRVEDFDASALKSFLGLAYVE